jgi:hypothetical protein
MTKENTNPYESPRSSFNEARAIVDRDSRERLIVAINAYLDEQTTNFEFDEQIHQIAQRTQDRTVDHAVNWLWFFYDDCKQHNAMFTKSEWDYIQRLVLMLRSNACLETTRQRRWSFQQVLAAIGLAAFLWCAWHIGWGMQLFVLALPFGALSIMLAGWNNRNDRAQSPWAWALYPFASFAEMRSVFESVPDFRKRRFPRHRTVQPIRGPLANFGIHLNAYATWLMFSPIVLVVQALPQSDEDVHVVLGKATS